MKNKIACFSTSVLLSLASPSNVMAVAVDLTSNLTISPGYHDFVQTRYSNTTGIGGWYGVGAGLKFNLDEQTSLTPGVDFMMNELQILIMAIQVFQVHIQTLYFFRKLLDVTNFNLKHHPLLSQPS